jgi:phthiocerol/phenolphthiocerol synthesis type-I polyketide synthase C
MSFDKIILFPGEGSQFKNMGRLQFKYSTTFRSTIKRLSIFVNSFNLVESFKKGDLWDDMNKIPIGIVAYQIGLLNMIGQNKKGTHPQVEGFDFCIGHSIGEIACAFLCGHLTEKQAIGIACIRVKVADHKNATGKMLYAKGYENQIKGCLNENVNIACYNSSQGFIISGTDDGISKFKKSCRKNDTNICVTCVNTGGIAFHTKHLEKIVEGFTKDFEDLYIKVEPFNKKWLTTALNIENLHSYKYHIDNIIGPVCFHQRVMELAHGANIFEIGSQMLSKLVAKTYTSNFVIRTYDDIFNTGILNEKRPLDLDTNNKIELKKESKSYLKGLYRLVCFGLPSAI